MPAIKETYLYFKKGYDWYMRRYYDKTTTRRFVGECDPTYAMAVSTLSPREIAQRIYRDFGEIKLVFILRNPVNKLYSWYRSALQYGWIWKKPKDNLVEDLSKGFDHYVDSQFVWSDGDCVPTWVPGPRPRTAYVAEGLYYDFIRPFTELWPAEKLKFILFEDYARDPEKILRELLDFIGADWYSGIDMSLKSNAGDRMPRSTVSILRMKAVKTLLNLYFHAVPFVSYDFCLKAMDLFQRLEKPLTKTYAKCPPMSDRTKRLLERFYNDDTRKLEQLLGRSLDDVWFPDTDDQAVSSICK